MLCLFVPADKSWDTNVNVSFLTILKNTEGFGHLWPQCCWGLLNLEGCEHGFVVGWHHPELVPPAPTVPALQVAGRGRTEVAVGVATQHPSNSATQCESFGGKLLIKGERVILHLQNDTMFHKDEGEGGKKKQYN